MYLVDIDGTVADLTHRLHLINGSHKNYDAFFDAMSDDAPIHDVIRVVNSLWVAGQKIVFVSGRPDSHRVHTVDWLSWHLPWVTSMGLNLYMRKAGDHRADNIVKEELLAQVLSDFPDEKIRGVFDDRPRVINMWKSKGLTVFKVGDWNVEQDQPIKASHVGTLTLLIGPSGAGKSTFAEKTFKTTKVISTDAIREQLTGDFKDQSKNPEVFHIARTLTETYLSLGLNVTIDATNLKSPDRKAFTKYAKGDIFYLVFDRPLKDKLNDAGWRPQWLIERHHKIFQDNLRNILNGDDNSSVIVLDKRTS